MTDKEDSHATIHRCSAKGCNFSTDNLVVFIDHLVEHRLAKVLPKAKVPTWEEKTEPKRHITAEEYVKCPECFPKIAKVLKERGWKSPEEKKKSRGLNL